MNIKEAARQATEEFLMSDKTPCLGEMLEEDIQGIILHAFKLAGYGWCPIDGAKKDGTEYWLSEEEDSMFLGSWCKHINAWYCPDLLGTMNPNLFHELPPRPKKQEAPNE